jgi:hypothetical protein
MKKSIIMMLIALASFTTSKAQTIIQMFSGTRTFDTLANTGTVTFATKANALNASKTGRYRVAVSITNLSGTSSGRMILQGSLNGTDYVNVFAVPGTNGVLCDTLTFTSGSPARHVWNVFPGSVKSVTDSTYWYTNAGYFPFLRVVITGTASQSTRINYVQVANY